MIDENHVEEVASGVAAPLSPSLVDTWSFILSLSYALRGIRSPQVVADAWRLLCEPILIDHERNIPEASLFPSLQTWAADTDGTSPSNRQYSQNELFRRIGPRLAGQLARIAGERAKADAMGLINDLLVHRETSKLMRAAIQEMIAAIGPRKSNVLGIVLYGTIRHTRPICVHSAAEVISSDGFRIKPHTFAVDGIQSEILGDIYVGQIAQEIRRGKPPGGIEWDTMRDHNESYPFWPSTLNAINNGFCHRCSVYSNGESIYWSDWPQIDAAIPLSNSMSWVFTTGVFRKETMDGNNYYRLIARKKWTIDW